MRTTAAPEDTTSRHQKGRQCPDDRYGERTGTDRVEHEAGHRNGNGHAYGRDKSRQGGEVREIKSQNKAGDHGNGHGKAKHHGKANHHGKAKHHGKHPGRGHR